MHPLEWSSPTRKKGHQILEPIPLEVYQEICDYFHENDDMSSQEVTRVLSNMALVCRFFSSIALPRLFKSVEFIIPESHHTSQTTNPRTTRFCRALVANQEPANSLVQYVKSCAFTNWFISGDPDNGRVRTQVPFLTLYCKALPKMNRVESVSLLSLEIDKRILKAIKSLPLLKSLSFVACDLAPDLDLDQFETFLRGLHLESFTALSIPNCISSMTTSPSFALDALTSLSIDNWMVVQRLAEHHPVNSLKELAIWEIVDCTLLATLFNKTPELLYLRVHHFIATHINDVDSIHLPGNLIPKLSHFDGPLALAKLLVPDRPIRKVILSGSWKGTEDEHPDPPLLAPQLWEALAKSTTPIKELLIPEHLYDTKSVRKYIPELAILSITWPAPSSTDIISLLLLDIEPLISRLCKRASPMPSVRRVTFRLDPIVADEYEILLYLQPQHAIINTWIVKVFPNIEQVKFADSVNWRRARPHGAWRAEIPKGRRESLLRQIKDREGVLEDDYGDCFKTFFDPNNPEYLDYAEK